MEGTREKTRERYRGKGTREIKTIPGERERERN